MPKLIQVTELQISSLRAQRSNPVLHVDGLLRCARNDELRDPTSSSKMDTDQNCSKKLY